MFLFPVWKFHLTATMTFQILQNVTLQLHQPVPYTGSNHIKELISLFLRHHLFHLLIGNRGLENLEPFHKGLLPLTDS